MKLKEKFIKLNSENRLYNLNVPIIGLTGGIASGKSTVGQILINLGLHVINADHLVKNVYSLPETLKVIKERYPSVIQNESISFPLLREKFFSDHEVKKDIESIIYQKLPNAFIDAFQKFSNPQFIIYDVPLLYEKKMQEKFDLTVLVYAPRQLQRDRLMIRDGHHEEMADNILNQQMDIEDKRLKADFIISNQFSETELTEEVKQFLRQILE